MDDDMSTELDKDEQTYEGLCALGHFTTALLSANRVADDDIKRARELFDWWSTNHFVWSLAKCTRVDTDAKRRPFLQGAHVFTELSRLRWFLDRHGILDTSYALCHTERAFWMSFSSMARRKASKNAGAEEEADDASDSDDFDEEEDAQRFNRLLDHDECARVFDKPIMEMTQRELRIVIMFMTQVINELGADDLSEYTFVFRYVWLRIGYFLSNVFEKEGDDDQIPLDDEGMFVQWTDDTGTCVSFNSAYAAFVSFYVGGIYRRLERHRMTLEIGPLDAGIVPAHDVRERVETIIRTYFKKVSFEDIYARVCARSYEILGDAEWYMYHYPDGSNMLAERLNKLRPHMRARYFTELDTVQDYVLSVAHEQHISRIYVLHAISAYLYIIYNNESLDWLHRVVVLAEDIDTFGNIIQLEEAPLIIQFMSRFWVYYKHQVFRTDDIYATLYVWCLVLRREFGSRLHEQFDLSEFVSAIIGDAAAAPEDDAFFI